MRRARWSTAYAGVGEPVFGQDDVPATWQLVTTAGFEFVRPGRDDVDRRPTFEPNSVLDGLRAV